ncbi:phage gp6-like head-tail connector protein [Sphingobacterium sp. SGG-5]|uniref:head-tail connector protein n=1 Tax=Sphingobacterium sp. SGG-5 TaxID=2710881 RepID=UPI0013EBA695|nr:head-tail connector protein [Sphingobacterium sp. SGG-5]NGM63502.1 phage gp6-like head-tail connector protein [Sphingobacterium sp. SGG-5]
MDALHVISLQEAKDNLRVDFPDDDNIIARLIKTSVDWVERYTCHTLYCREKKIVSDGCTIEVYDYPVTVLSVVKDGSPVNYTTQTRSDKLLIYAPKGALVTLKVGYDDVRKVPGVLIEACHKLITYLYENRDAYSMGIPVDIQGLINQYRRGLF